MFVSNEILDIGLQLIVTNNLLPFWKMGVKNEIFIY